jgi:hypothetical protein
MPERRPTSPDERRLAQIAWRQAILAAGTDPWDQQAAADYAYLLERLGVELPTPKPN